MLSTKLKQTLEAKMNTPITIGQRIRKLRQERGWSQQDLSDKSGVLRQTINLIENDKSTRITYEVMVSLAKTLEVTPEELQGNLPPEKNEAYTIIAKLEMIKAQIDMIIKDLRQL